MSARRRHGVNNLVSLWLGLTLAKRMVLVAATVGMFLAVLALARMAPTGGQSLLYAGLDGRTAGDVITALDQAGVTYDVRGDSIYVPTAARDGLRMQLAGQGLPASGGAGYELLDGLSGFGTTSQMFDAAYWRAKEGELARTILAMPQIRAARVHISQGNKSGFLRDQSLTASVTVTTSSGSLSAEQANALRHLVASATGNLKPDDVSVIDSVAGLIGGQTDSAALASGDARALEIKRNVERLLAARVGPGRAIVEVSVDILREREAISERTFDPQARVAISSDSEQTSESSKDGQADVTVASNLPDGDGAAGASGESQSTTSRERLNFEVSQTQRDVLREPGAIRRLTVAVLVDGVPGTAADGTRTWQPRAEAELADLRELVSSAAGLDEARGDVLTLKSLEFQTVPTEGVLAEAGFLSQLGPVDVMSVIQILVLSLVSLVLGLFVLRPLLTQRGGAMAAPAMAGGALALPGPAESGMQSVLTGEISDGFDLPAMPMVNFDASGMYSEPSNDPMARLRRLIDERQSESVEILRNWMEKEEERG
ncbi:flagellar basal-body MS-ring/collar protein FliF [Tabrizicola alkalilacus]|uniref:Flagellar M-ring protein n=1 Tax=Pseudotabrizicola alkalilacus TaxID=2305252 RepID=A0A411Z6M5_9RHOB|nr:flagellar M-ring protein FliF [Pseudotabrizicola alkalilacus]